MAAKGLAERVVDGDRSAVARAITMVENREKGVSTLLDRIGRNTGRAFVVGITGPPGVGKSTLVDRLIGRFGCMSLRVGVIAVDPSSPFTGGALLGDRVRMAEHALDESVFVRSMASRGWAGGVSAATADVVQILDAAGFQVILLETMGIGQADIEVMRIAHLVVVVVMPGMGDDIQMSKAGLMEIGDVYVVNKSDLEGANHAVATLTAFARESRRKPVVLGVSAQKDEGVGRLAEEVEKQRRRLSLPEGRDVRARTVRGMLFELAKQRRVADIEERLAGRASEEIVSRVLDRTLSLEVAVKRLLGEA